MTTIEQPEGTIYLACDNAAGEVISPYLWGGTELLLHRRHLLPEAYRATYQPHRHHEDAKEAAGPVLIAARSVEILKTVCHYLHDYHCDVPDGWRPLAPSVVTELAGELRRTLDLDHPVIIWTPPSREEAQHL